MMEIQINIPADIEAAGPDVIEHYLSLIDSGQSASFAGIIAMRKTPGLKTDSAMVAAQNQERGGATLADQFRGNENLLQYRIQQARKNGYEPKATDFYNSSMARFPGDPRAFTGASQSIGDIKRDMARTGDGLAVGDRVIQAQETDVAPEPPKKLAEHIVTRIQKQRIEADPGLAHKDQRELRSQIKDEHGSKDKEAVE